MKQRCDGNRADADETRVFDGVARLEACGHAPREEESLQRVEQQQDEERRRQHDQSDSGGACIVELLELDDDQERRDLGHHRQIAGDEDHRAVFAHRTREGECRARQQRRRQCRQDDATERLQARRAQRRGGLFGFQSKIGKHRLQRAHHERQADESERHDHAQRRVGDLHAQQRQKRRAEPALRRIERGQRDAGDGRRQRKRQIHQRIDQALERKAVAHQHPGHDQTEDRVDRRRRSPLRRRKAPAPPARAAR